MSIFCLVPTDDRLRVRFPLVFRLFHSYIFKKILDSTVSEVSTKTNTCAKSSSFASSASKIACSTIGLYTSIIGHSSCNLLRRAFPGCFSSAQRSSIVSWAAFPYGSGHRRNTSISYIKLSMCSKFRAGKRVTKFFSK